MASGVTFWGRVGDRETMDAVAFLRLHKYGADRTRDLDGAPPVGDEWEQLRKGSGGTLALCVDPRHMDAAARPEEEALPGWFAADTSRLRAPLLLTPRGALAGFGERRWAQFLDIGKGR